MSNFDGTYNNDGQGYIGASDDPARPGLSQQSSNSTGATQSSYSSPAMASQSQPPYPFPDPSMTGMMLPVSAQNPDWWSHGAMIPHINTSVDMLSNLELSRSAGLIASPVSPDDMTPRRVSIASTPELADWQEKVRVEVSSSNNFPHLLRC